MTRNEQVRRRQHVVVISGAGVSAASGVSTFRDRDGLWAEVSIEDVATPEAFQRDPVRVLEFYNRRRRQLEQVRPNAAHLELAALESDFDVSIVTQNVDDLHERAGSSAVLHLHGRLTQARSVADETRLYDIGYEDIHVGDVAEDGAQLRPHVVWFGETVPMIETAAQVVARADHVLVVGTSLQVYPAAGLVGEAAPGVPVTVIDPAETVAVPGAELIRATACEGVARWVAVLRQRAGA